MALNKQAVLEYIFIFKFIFAKINLTFIDLNYMHKKSYLSFYYKFYNL